MTRSPANLVASVTWGPGIVPSLWHLPWLLLLQCVHPLSDLLGVRVLVCLALDPVDFHRSRLQAWKDEIKRLRANASKRGLEVRCRQSHRVVLTSRRISGWVASLRCEELENGILRDCRHLGRLRAGGSCTIQYLPPLLGSEVELLRRRLRGLLGETRQYQLKRSDWSLGPESKRDHQTRPALRVLCDAEIGLAHGRQPSFRDGDKHGRHVPMCLQLPSQRHRRPTVPWQIHNHDIRSCIPERRARHTGSTRNQSRTLGTIQPHQCR